MKGKGLMVKVLALVVAFGGAVALTRMLPEPERSVPAATPTTERPTLLTSTSTEGVRTSAPNDATSSKTVAGERWQKVAQRFITRYGVRKTTRKVWLAQLRPLVSDQMYAGLRTVRLGNRPSGTYGTGQVTAVSEVGGTMRFPLVRGSFAAVDVTVSATDEGTLRVTSIEPVTGVA